MRGAPAAASVAVVGGVYIVDDNPPFRAVARALLESGGYRVVGEAANGAEALSGVLSGAGDGPPDVVLLDIGLPDMDGFSVSRALHRAAPEMVIVFCSVRDEDHYGDAVARSCAAGFLPKSRLSATALAGIVAAARPGQADRR